MQNAWRWNINHEVLICSFQGLDVTKLDGVQIMFSMAENRHCYEFISFDVWGFTSNRSDVNLQ